MCVCVCIYIYIIDSLCYTPRTNTTLYIKMGHIFLFRLPWNKWRKIQVILDPLGK